jgi:hypothetical protein
VGKTEQILKERVEEHKRDVKYQRHKPIMKHFENHDGKDLHVAVMAKTVGETQSYGLIVEENWIRSLETQTPHGCNIKLINTLMILIGYSNTTWGQESQWI